MTQSFATLEYGKFITVEGTEGVGKSTNIAFIQHYLEEQGVSVLTTREPGGTPLAEQIRALLLQQHHDDDINETTELLLVFAARSQHLQSVILPALRSGKWVVCDRFTDATYAYQGGGRGLDTGFIHTLEQSVQKGVCPDLTLLLDIDVQKGLARARKRSMLDRFEQEQVAFFDRVRASYLQLADESPERYTIIDAAQSVREVQQQIAARLRGFMSTIHSSVNT